MKRTDSLRTAGSRDRIVWLRVSGHPLELYPDIAWESYCQVAWMGEHVGGTVATCGLVVEQRTHHQITGEPMKFLTLADRTRMMKTELFVQTHKDDGWKPWGVL